MLLSTTKSESQGEKGNCLAAALGSILGLKIDDIPQFEEMSRETWKDALHNWSSSIGVRIQFTKSIPKGLSVGIGRHKTGSLHAVVLDDGAFYFDPNGTEQFYEEHCYCLSVEKVKTNKTHS